MEQYFLTAAERMRDELVRWRRELHQKPECGMDLPKTSDFVKKKLTEMNISYQEIPGGSGIVGFIGNHSKGNCFLLRSDMDALPIKEETGLPFASQNDCMHACGHDIHTTVLLGAAKLLKEKEEELCGTVKLLFQPGEELFQGAKNALEGGVLENPDVGGAFSMHISPQAPVGTVFYGKLPMSAVYGFKITINGKGGHGAFPDLCVDPINVGIHTHLALQELISRECPTSEEVVLTIGSFQAGDLSNIIPATAVLQGTLRTFGSDISEIMIQRIHEVVHSVARTYRATAEIEVLSNVPGVKCDEALMKEFVGYIGDLSDQLTAVNNFRAMSSEDFAFITEKVPAAFFALGGGVPDETQRYGLHNPQVTFDESGIAIGAACYAQIAFQWLKTREQV